MKLATALLAALVLSAPLRAHDGPPYPILVDEEVSGLSVSVWADPDVGVGTFYFYVDPLQPGASCRGLEIEVVPQDGHSERLSFAAVPAEQNEPFQLVGEVDFDRRGMWDVVFTITGSGDAEELAIPVDVTPPGLGTFDMLWFLSPFLAVGFLWIKVMLAKRGMARTASSR